MFDPNIYQRINQVNPDELLNSYQKGVALGDQQMERQVKLSNLAKAQRIQDIYKNSVNKDGSINQEMLLSGLAKEDPEKMMSTKKQFNELEKSSYDLQDAQQKAILGQLSITGPATKSLIEMSDEEAQKSLPAFKVLLEKNNLAVNKMPMDSQGNPIWDRRYYTNAYLMAKNTKDNLERMKIESSIQKDNEDLKLTRAKTAKELSDLKYSQNKAGLTEGQKAVDKDFAKDYNDWTSGGSENARIEINKLKNVVSNLKKGNVSTGGMTGVLGDRFTSNNVLAARADVQSTVMNSLRSILGAQFTEKEGERIIKNTWNEADSTENNIARLNRLIDNLNAQANDKDLKAKYYEQVGSLAGLNKLSRDNNSQNQDYINKPSKDILGGTEANAGQYSQMPKKGAIDGGYVFIGGDPANPSNWKRAK